MDTKALSKTSKQFHRFSRFLRILGPGLITGAADDDPSGIATYAQTGAQFGLGQLWTVLFAYPLMTAVQETCARIGAVTGKGLAHLVKDRYSKKVLYSIIFLVAIANTINIGADIGAMTASVQLLVPHVSFSLVAILFTAIMLPLIIFTSYKSYARILKLLAITLLAYPLTAFIVAPPFHKILLATFIPHVEFNKSFLFILTGVLGTTISPYMFFWQASEEVEEEKEKHRLLHGIPNITHRFIRTLRMDNALGMLISQLATWFIIIVAAATLHDHGVTNVATAADAAKALEPLVKNFPHAGILAKTIFASGIIGLGLLAVPILAGSASYALSEAFDWKEGLNRKLRTAKGFYGVIVMATLAGLLMNMVGIDPIQALIFTAVFNGIASVPLLFIIARLARDEKVMGEYKSGIITNALVWLTFIFMFIAVGAMGVSFFLK